MLKQLRFDLYKIVKSKTIRVFLIISAIVCLINPLIPILERGLSSGKWLSQGAFFNVIDGRIPYLLYELVMLFPLVFVLKDFSSGFIKNIYTETNKFYYVLSKIICIVLYAIILRIAYFIISFLVHCCFFNGKIKELLYVKEQYYSINFGIYFLEQILTALASAAVGCLVLVVTLLVKKEFISAIIVLPYGLYAYSLLTNSFVTLTYLIIKNMKVSEILISFTPFRMVNRLQEIRIFASNILTSWMYLVVIVGCVGLSLLLGWLLVRKKNV